jgi:hypothetical protein
MRLLHSETLEFHEFYDSSVPPYAILSHTWDDGEISYQDMVRLRKAETYVEKAPVAMVLDLGALLAKYEHIMTRELSNSRGYAKVKKTAEIARRHGYDYFWVDTCTIDKSSSAELQEAINSMYLWYQKSALCIVYLGDVDADSVVDLQPKLKT